MTHYFKYMPASTARVVLGNQTLRWSTPATLNDPFDMQFAFQPGIDQDVVRPLAMQKFWNHYSGELGDRPPNALGLLIRITRERMPGMGRVEFEERFSDVIGESVAIPEASIDSFNKMVFEHFSDTKVLCLSAAPDIILMWSYYAQNHAGVVLRFTDETPDNPISMGKAVQYVNQLPSMMDNESLSDMLAGYGGIDAERVIDDVVYTKSNHWAHEREWRISSGAGRTRDAFEDIPFGRNEIDGVIFGLRTAEDDRREIGALVGRIYPHAQLFQASIRPGAYALDIAESVRP
ncbi:DUF2971 domain-containing protein [Phenylobacterium sp.]|uniref:DUF2971 domain-containing protein n=1 Tax=Phenylobacterium sp. TaxID=1871053 RepID=UPI00271CA222|nr:DUF2971 domain-containing protein [Phenylobacterium sp.]MDO8802183.1 DUF2971 domain-containing protein [Phenylobacterium sp.]